MKIIGIKRSTGEFNSKPYDNLNLHVVEDFNAESAVGQRTEVVKIRMRVVEEILSKVPTEAEIKSWAGKNLTVYYDKNQNVNFFEIGGQ